MLPEPLSLDGYGVSRRSNKSAEYHHPRLIAGGALRQKPWRGRPTFASRRLAGSALPQRRYAFISRYGVGSWSLGSRRPSPAAKCARRARRAGIAPSRSQAAGGAASAISGHSENGNPGRSEWVFSEEQPRPRGPQLVRITTDWPRPSAVGSAPPTRAGAIRWASLARSAAFLAESVRPLAGVQQMGHLLIRSTSQHELIPDEPSVVEKAQPILEVSDPELPGLVDAPPRRQDARYAPTVGRDKGAKTPRCRRCATRGCRKPLRSFAATHLAGSRSNKTPAGATTAHQSWIQSLPSSNHIGRSTRVNVVPEPIGRLDRIKRYAWRGPERSAPSHMDAYITRRRAIAW